MKNSARVALGVALSALLLWWSLRDVSLREVHREILAADPLLFVLAAVIATAGIPFRAVRWHSLLRGLPSQVPLQPRMAATSLGFAANNLLPARVGELVRAVSLQRIARVPLGAVIGSLVLERILDAVVIVGFLFAAMAAPSFPAGEIGGIDPAAAARWAAAAAGVLAVPLFFMAAAPARFLALADGIIDRILPAVARPHATGLIHAFVEGLSVLRSPRLLAVALLWTVAQWAFLATSFLLAFRAFGIDHVSYGGAVFLQSLSALAVAVPSSPGFFGPFEAAAKVGLQLWGVSAERAVSFAIGFHIAGYIPVTLLGLAYAWKLNLRLGDMGRERESAPEALGARRA